MFNFVSVLKYKRHMAGNKLCKPALDVVKSSRNLVVEVQHSPLHGV